MYTRKGILSCMRCGKYGYNRLTLASSTKTLPDTTSAKKYLVVARVPRVPSEGEDIQEYDDYCMTGDSPPGPGPGSKQSGFCKRSRTSL